MRFPDRRTRKYLNAEFFTLATETPYHIDQFTDCKTVLDLGANSGMFSLLARFAVRQARIIAVEPDPMSFSCLADNVTSLPIEAHNWAIGPQDGFCVLRSSKTMSSVDRKYRLAEGQENNGSMIHCLTLSSMFSRLKIDPVGCFVKADCEGEENGILESAESKEVFSSCLGFSIELHPESVDPWREFFHFLQDSGSHRLICESPVVWHRGGKLAMRRVS